MAGPWEEERSDDDSISVTSTVPEDPDASYDVEEILAEERSQDDGIMRYLVKWQRYPLQESTFEPKEHFESELILQGWQKKKQAIAAKEIQPFDINKYYKLVEVRDDAKLDRQRRRKAKRIRLGMATSRDESVSNGSIGARDAAQDSGDDGLQPPRQKRQKTAAAAAAAPPRKGVAQKVKKSLNRAPVAASSSEEDSEDDYDSGAASDDSLMEEGRSKAKDVPPRKSSSKAAAKPTNQSAAQGSRNNSSSAVPSKQRTQTQAVASTNGRVSSSTHARADDLSTRAPGSGPARKSAPSSGNLNTQSAADAQSSTQKRLPVLPTDPRKSRKSITDAFVNADRNEARRTRDISNQTNHTRFRNLAEENRVRKASAREAPPDVSMLSTFNAATGKYEPSAAAAAAATAATAATAAPATAIATTVTAPDAAASTTTTARSGPVAPVAPMGRPSATSSTHTQQPASPSRNGSLIDNRSAQVSIAQSVNAAPPPPPRTSRSVGNVGMASAPSVFGRREAPAPVRRRSMSPPSEPGPDHGPMGFSDHNERLERTKTCNRWLRGHCPFSDNECWFAHWLVQPLRTCSFWRTPKGCKFSDAECQFEHRELDPRARGPMPRNAPRTTSITDAPPDPRGVNRLDTETRREEVQGVAERFESSDPRLPAEIKSLPTKQRLTFKDITCHLWFAGKCHKPISECTFAHHDTGHHIDLRDVTCHFWLDDKCNRSEADCKFAHHYTGYKSGLPGSGVIFVQSAPRDPPSRDQPDRDPGEIIEDDPMILDTEAASHMVASPIDMTTTSRRGSTAVPRLPGPPAYTHNVILAVACSEDEFELTAKLACSTPQHGSMLKEIMGATRRLHMRKLINIADLKRSFADTLQQGGRFPDGDILCGYSDSRLDKFVEACRSQASCGVVVSSEYTLLAYPADTEEWKFLSNLNNINRSDIALRFKLLPALPTEMHSSLASTSNAVTNTAHTTETARAAPETITPSKMITAPETITAPAVPDSMGLDMERLLKINSTKTEDKVFIMVPPDREVEARSLEQVFKDRFKQADYKNRSCKVWTSIEPGSWDQCHKHTACLLLVHPGVPLWEIEELGKLLCYTTFRVFCIGRNPGIAAREGEKPEYGFQRLFPMGDVVFITDELFTHRPKKVLQIIDDVNLSNGSKPLGAVRNKIAARPGVRAWLTQHVAQQDLGRKDPLWLILLDKVWKLYSADKENNDYPGNPSEDADLVSIAPELLPTFQTLLQTSQSDATDYAVNWFAGWAFINAAKYRRFTVCHEEPGTGKEGFDKDYNKVIVGAEPDPRGWAKEFRYLMVKTPDKWLQDAELKRSGKK